MLKPDKNPKQLQTTSNNYLTNLPTTFQEKEERVSFSATFESLFIANNHPNINLLDSIIVITQDNKKLYKGRAVLYILKKINKLKPITYFLTIFPSKLIDFFYTIIAKTRYKIFGKYDSCPFVEKKYLKKILK